MTTTDYQILRWLRAYVLATTDTLAGTDTRRVRDAISALDRILAELPNTYLNTGNNRPSY